MDVLGFVASVLAITIFIFLLVFRIRNKGDKKSLFSKILEIIQTIISQN